MLSYRHGFHAGNHADVLKHFILVQLLDYMLQKDKAIWYVDTHAGAAQYALTDSTALKNAEFETGIGRLWGRRGLPPALESYVAQVKRVNSDPRKLKTYPGSPQIALQMLRPQDRLRLFEKHSTEIRILQQNVPVEGRRAIALLGDGFESLKSVLPPPSRRGLVLIDPSYEDKADYKRTKQALVDALGRFATGTYAIWYPQVQRRESMQLPNSLKLAGADDWLHVSLTVKAPAADGYGLHGSGMFIVNPPWTLADTLRQTMPWLNDALSQDHEATFVLETGS
jgi:23S rRNA (adenine2030-N6)-methyltransferase